MRYLRRRAGGVCSGYLHGLQPGARIAAFIRPNPAFKTEEAITQLGKGEALVSVLDVKGVPTMVERTMVRPPSSRMGPITPEERQKIVRNSPVYGNYEEAEDRESAYEILMKRAEERSAAADQAKAQKEADQQARAQARTPTRETATDRFVKNMASTAGRQIGNMLIRGILGGLKKW